MATGVQKHVFDTESSLAPGGARTNFFVVDLSLRFLLFSMSVTSLAITVTSNQVKTIPNPFNPSADPVVLEAKFTYSSAIVYFVVALSAASLYSVLTGIASASSISHPSSLLLLRLAILDAVMAGIMASGTGAVASIAYIGLKGNDHIAWTKVCNVFDKFCGHAGIAIALSLGASIILVVLVGVSAFSLHRRSR